MDDKPIEDARVLDQLYDVAVDPARLEALVETWEGWIGRGNMAGAFADTSFEDHFNRAALFLDRWQDGQDQEAGKYQTVLKNLEKVAAFSVDSSLVVRAVNDQAAAVLHLEKGSRLADLPFEPEDVDHLQQEVRATLRDLENKARTLRFHSMRGNRSVIFQIRAAFDVEIGPFAVIVTSETGWPEGFDGLLADTFGLSKAEISVLRAIVECKTLREIAQMRERSVETVRAQVRAIMGKTDTHTQAELVRLVLTLLDVVSVDTTEDVGAPLPDTQMTLEPRETLAVLRSDGRRLEYLVLGDPKGRPVLFLPSDLGFTRWPASAEAAAKARGIKVVVMIRGGYGGSDFYRKGSDIDAEIATDIRTVLDREGVKTCPIISIGSDGFFAFSFAAKYPDRVKGIIMCEGILPLTKTEQYERMDKWYRFILANARYAPHLLPFMVKAGYLWARKQGKRKFMHSVFANSAGDLRMCDDPECYAAIAEGSDVTLSDTKTAHQAFAAEAILYTRTNWAEFAEAIRGKVPVKFLWGNESQYINRDTFNEFVQDYDWIEFREYDGIGALLFFREWRDVLDMLEEL